MVQIVHCGEHDIFKNKDVEKNTKKWKKVMKIEQRRFFTDNSIVLNTGKKNNFFGSENTKFHFVSKSYKDLSNKYL